MTIDQSVLVEIRPGLRVLWALSGAGQCRSCGAWVLWCVTTGGKRVPVNEPASPGAATASHFSTCPQAQQWRRPR